jgi:Na+/phosphate symporter
LNLAFKEIKETETYTYSLKGAANRALDKIPDHELEAGHFYILVVDYLHEMSENMFDIVKSSLGHVDNNHKPLLPEQIDDLREVDKTLKSYYEFIGDLMKEVKDIDEDKLAMLNQNFVKALRSTRKKQIKRIKEHTVGTRNSVLYLNQLSDYRNIGLYAQRLINVYKNLIQNPMDD